MQYLISLSLTLLFEEALALLWGIRGRDLWLVALANGLTNPAVVLVHNLVPGLILGTVVPELAAIFLEAAVYLTKENRIRKPVLFSLCANGCSYFLGLLLSMLL